MWIAAGLAAAIGCLAAAGIGFAVIEAARRRHRAAGIGSQLSTLRSRVSVPAAARPRPATPPRKVRRPRSGDWPSQESRYGW
jgi:hypothetical protein